QMAETIRVTAPGTTMKQLGPIVEDARARIDRMTMSWNNFKTSLGATVAPAVIPALEKVQKALDYIAAESERSNAWDRQGEENDAYEKERALTPPKPAGRQSGG